MTVVSCGMHFHKWSFCIGIIRVGDMKNIQDAQITNYGVSRSHKLVVLTVISSSVSWNKYPLGKENCLKSKITKY